MLDDVLFLEANDTTTQQQILISPSSANQQSPVFPSHQSASEYRLLKDVASFSLMLPRVRYSEAFQTMLASERVLRKDWDHPEEDEAWAHL